LGHDYEDDHCVEFRNTFTNNMIRDPVRGTALFETTSGNQFTVEELVAMQFALAKQQAEETAGESVKDVVITVSLCSRYNLSFFSLLGRKEHWLV
jgi:hypoxia up-regulated 1